MADSTIKFYEIFIRSFELFTKFLLVILVLAFMVKSNFVTGRDFWKPMEEQFYRFSDEPELRVDNKDKLIDALHKVHVKMKPYIDALFKD
jgi:hypothetical protein